MLMKSLKTIGYVMALSLLLMVAMSLESVDATSLDITAAPVPAGQMSQGETDGLDDQALQNDPTETAASPTTEPTAVPEPEPVPESDTETVTADPALAVDTEPGPVAVSNPRPDDSIPEADPVTSDQPVSKPAEAPATTSNPAPSAEATPDSVATPEPTSTERQEPEPDALPAPGPTVNPTTQPVPDADPAPEPVVTVAPVPTTDEETEKARTCASEATVSQREEDLDRERVSYVGVTWAQGCEGIKFLLIAETGEVVSDSFQAPEKPEKDGMPEDVVLEVEINELNVAEALGLEVIVAADRSEAEAGDEVS